MTSNHPGRWRKSKRSNSEGACVEIAARPDAVAVRDSKDPAGPILVFETGSWRGFLAYAKRH